MKLLSFFSVLFCIILLATCDVRKNEQSILKARAVDNDTKISMIKVTDGNEVYPVVLMGLRNILTPSSSLNKYGYRLKCDSSDGLNSLLKVFGYDLTQFIALTNTYHEEDILVSNAQVLNNPILNCNSSNVSTLLKLKLTNGEYQYYLDFGKKVSGKNIYFMSGCQELITALGHIPQNAHEITAFTISSFANNSDDYDLNCNIKDRIEWLTDSGNIPYIELNVNSEAGSSISPIKLIAKVKNAPTLRLEYSIVSNSCGNGISLNSQNQIVGQFESDFTSSSCELEVIANVVNLEHQYRAAHAKIKFNLGEYLGYLEWNTPFDESRSLETVIYARSSKDSDPIKITAQVKSQPSMVVNYFLQSNTCGDIVKLDPQQGIIYTKKVADDFRGCEVYVEAKVANLERNYRSAHARILIIKSWEDFNVGELVIPMGVSEIKNMAFEGRKLTSVVIPDSVTTIGNYAFSTNNIVKVSIPSSVIHIGESAFDSNLLTEIIIPRNVRTIESWAFSSNKLTKITIPENVSKIGIESFDSNLLTSIVIPNSVKEIHYGAFERNPITQITIGANVSFNYEGDITDNWFFAYYKSKNKKAGKYKYENGNWTGPF